MATKGSDLERKWLGKLECLLANRRWERAVMCGYWVRFAQQALGHNSKAVHHACSKHAEVTVPSLDDWEKEWQKAE